MSCLSQFSSISILLNIKKSIETLGLSVDNKECVWPVHRNIQGSLQRSQNLIIILPRGDEVIVHWLLRMVLFALSNH